MSSVRVLPHLKDRRTGLGIGQVRGAIAREARIFGSRCKNTNHLVAAQERTDKAIANYQKAAETQAEKLAAEANTD